MGRYEKAKQEGETDLLTGGRKYRSEDRTEWLAEVGWGEQNQELQDMTVEQNQTREQENEATRQEQGKRHRT